MDRCDFLCRIISDHHNRNLWLMVVNKTTQNGVASTFYCFLPMCFYFVGGEIMKLQKENRELRKIVEELAKKPPELSQSF
jgi:hypothetical protein